MTDPVALCFVCLGNICRSPLAEGVFLHLARERGVADRFAVDSSGTGGWHVGNAPDPRSVAVAAQHGVRLPSRARQFHADDIERFDLFLAMDVSNRDTLIDRGVPADRVRLMRSFDPACAGNREPEVPDPYYGGEAGFEDVYTMLEAACNGLLDELTTRSIR